MLFFLVSLPLFSLAQQNDWDIAFQKSIPTGNGQPIHLPVRDYNSNFSVEPTYNYWQKRRVYIISSDSIYRKLFWRYIYTRDSLKKYKELGVDNWYYSWMEKHLVDSLPAIDFLKNELVMYAACAQCLAFCKHGDERGPCHRNACHFHETWFIRNKKK